MPEVTQYLAIRTMDWNECIGVRCKEKDRFMSEFPSDAIMKSPQL